MQAQNQFEESVTLLDVKLKTSTDEAFWEFRILMRTQFDYGTLHSNVRRKCWDVSNLNGQK